jgi:hypothetical protein
MLSPVQLSHLAGFGKSLFLIVNNDIDEIDLAESRAV